MIVAWMCLLPLAASRAAGPELVRDDNGAAAATEAPLPFPWPEARRAAVSLAYDDALDSQLDNALPALDRYGFKATFYLTLASDAVARRMAEWRAAAASGHELGNHSLFHQCSGSAPDRAWVAPERDLDATSAGQMRDQVLLANVALQALDGRSRRTFTAPCGETLAGDGDYAALVAPAFVATKRGIGPVTDMATLDPDAVPVDAPVGVAGSELIARVEQAARVGGMVNFTFHGIGGDHLAVSTRAHDELLEHLAAHPDIYWVDTFLEIMTHVRDVRTRPVD
ncbi:polysaccharide deacetylase family protein [Luteimonas sp. SJ-92]|uniref:Polysaccharide deacetylase family protein n=2 Tax=Luteimonas salinisoli TaxID=2752307 RepID=A0A853J960_9GAMM|nr:polysaccharide deacetylase family protein [Luteimonas salinisoli]